MALNTLAIDIGKHSFHVFGIDDDGVVISHKVSRAKLATTVERLDPKIVAMEACGSAHHWGRLRRTLDWPFPGLGRHVEVALQDGGAGAYANVTWPGAVGVLTAIAPGRFAAAINQAPMFRRFDSLALLPADFILNGLDVWRGQGRWPAAHLLRFAFDRCASYDEAVELLAETPLARPTLFSVVGAEPGQGCLIERTATEAVLHRGCGSIANDWHPDGRPRAGRWIPRGRFVCGMPDSSQRRMALDSHSSTTPFDWLAAPVLNGLTRLAVEASPATGELRVLGLEPTSTRMTEARPVTNRFEARVTSEGILLEQELEAA